MEEGALENIYFCIVSAYEAIAALLKTAKMHF